MDEIDLFEYLENSGWKTSNNILKNQCIINIKGNFSISENSDFSIKIFRKVFSFKYSKEKNITLNFKECERIGLCSLNILGIILIHLKSVKKDFKIKIIYPESLEIQKIIKSFDIVDHLNYDLIEKGKTDFCDIEKINRLKMIIGGVNGFDSIMLELIDKGFINLDFGTSAIIEVTEFFDDCFRNKGFCLSDEGKNKIKGMIGEIVTNLKEHLGKTFAQYYISGIYTDISDSRGIGELAFFNFGDTFYEGLKNNSTEDIKKTLEEFSFQKKKVYNNFDEELFWTQLALFQSISREYVKGSNKTRGTGTINLLNFLFNISSKNENDYKPKISLISGSSKIQFDISERKYYNKDEGTLIFNDDEDIFKKQNKNNLIKLKEFYPGTIISLKFLIDKTWLNKVKGAK